MSRDSNVTYAVVRRACCEILARGERPARPNVQELLDSDEYLGQKGSNAIVAKLINDFWLEVGETIKTPTRVVADIPSDYVATIDKALADMIAISRTIASQELAEREDGLKAQETAIQRSIQDARDAAAAADQLRLRAEGERNALQSSAGEMKRLIADLEQRLAAEGLRCAGLASGIEAKDVELRHQAEAITAAQKAREAAEDAHRKEVKRLMQQIDDERQAATKELKRREHDLSTAKNERDSVRLDLERARTDVARLTGETIRLTSEAAARAEALSAAQAAQKESTSSLAKLHSEATALRVRYETAEQHRKEALLRIDSQSQEIGELRGRVESLLSQNEKNRRNDNKSSRSKKVKQIDE